MKRTVLQVIIASTQESFFSEFMDDSGRSDLEGPEKRERDHHDEEEQGRQRKPHFHIIPKSVAARAHNQNVDRVAKRRNERH